MVPDVATSISCRDINSRNYNLQLNTSLVATSVFCRDNSLSFISFIFPTCHSFKALLVATSIPCRDMNLCRDITVLSRHHSLCLWLFLSCLTCDPCRDLHSISFNFSDVATSQLDCANLKIAALVDQLLSFLPCHFLHFYSSNCCIFLLLFLLSFTFPANNKLVSFFIFLHINYSFLYENRTEK